MSPILEPLAPFRKHLTIISDCETSPAKRPNPTAISSPRWLTCVKPWDFGVAGPDSGVSADQLAARHIGRDTRLPSLELTTAQVGARLAWERRHNRCRRKEIARGGFKSFSARRYSERTRGYSRRDGSILDRVKKQAARLPGQPWSA